MNRRIFMSSLLLSAISLYAKEKNKKVIKILNYEDYFAEDTIKNFSLQTGIKIELDTYGSDTQMIAMFLRSNPRYDLMIISDANVERFIRFGGILSAINKKLIPNIKNIEKEFFISSFDPNRIYSLPYFWGILGIGYRKSAFKNRPDTLKHLLDSAEHSGRIALLADGVTNIQMALKYLGFSLNSTNKEELNRAKKLLMKQRKHIGYFAADNGQDLLKDGKVDIVLEWNGDMLQLVNESDEFGFITPKEGTLLWEDCLVIPTRTPNPKDTHNFINYLFDEKVGFDLATYLEYASPNEKVKSKMPSSYLQNPAIFPTPQILKKSEKIKYNGAKIKSWYDKAWAEILASE